MKNIKIITNQYPKFPFNFRFSKGKVDGKVQAVGFKDQAIHDLNHLSYEPKEPLKFVNGKALLYQYNRSLLTSFFRSTFYTIPLTSIAYLIIKNPFAAVFPAAIPILFVVELVLLKMFFTRIKWNHKIIQKIQLLETGDITQIQYANQRKRALTGEPLKTVYYNTVFVNPDFEKEEGVMDINLFPEDIKQFNNKKTYLGYSWTKHYSNGQNYIIIPKKADYMNKEVLIEIFKGKVIRKKV